MLHETAKTQQRREALAARRNELNGFIKAYSEELDSVRRELERCDAVLESAARENRFTQMDRAVPCERCHRPTTFSQWRNEKSHAQCFPRCLPRSAESRSLLLAVIEDDEENG